MVHKFLLFTKIFLNIFIVFSSVAQNTKENLPLYGGITKSNEEIKADEEFVKETISLYGTLEKAFKTFVDIGWKNIVENNLDESITEFNKAWLLNPANADPYLGLSLVMQIKQKQTETDKLFKQGIILDKDKKSQMKFYLRAVDYAGRKKDTVMLIQFLKQSLSVDPNSILIYKKLAYYTSLKGQNNDAVAAYSGAIRISPNDSSLYYNRGLIYKKMKQFNEAISDFTSSIKLSKNEYFEAIFNRGMSKYDSGDYAGSIEDYNVCIKLNSKLPLLYRFLGISLIMAFDQKGACGAWKTAKKLGDLQSEELYNAQCK